jgi:quinohemoprotein ethanol dehydrogenase
LPAPHGLRLSGGFAPDLRASAIPLSAAAFHAVVRGGSLQSRGMPRLADLSEEDLENLRHYLRSRARGSLK